VQPLFWLVLLRSFCAVRVGLVVRADLIWVGGLVGHGEKSLQGPQLHVQYG